MSERDFIRKTILEASKGITLARLAKICEAERGTSYHRVRIVLAALRKKGELSKRGKSYVPTETLFAITRGETDEAHKPRVAVTKGGTIHFYGRTLSAEGAMVLSERLQEAAIEAFTSSHKSLIEEFATHEEALAYIADTWPFTPAGRLAEGVLKK